MGRGRVVGVGKRLLETRRLLNFPPNRMGAYSRWALIWGWALNWINTVCSKKVSYTKVLGPVPERPISANPGLKFCSTFCIYLPMHCLARVLFWVISSFFVSKAQQYFVSSSYMFLDKKTLLKIWLSPVLNLIIFPGTGPCIYIFPSMKIWNKRLATINHHRRTIQWPLLTGRCRDIILAVWYAL